jgi:6-phosphogluconolactonase
MSFTLLSSGYGGEIATLQLDLSSSPSTFTTSSVQPSGNAPTWLTLHPSLPVVYTGDEFAEPQGQVHSYRIASDGSLSPLNSKAVGAGPVHFAIKGEHFYSANYGGGSLSTVGLKEDGSFGEEEGEHFQYEGTGPHKERQEAPHTHGVYVTLLSILILSR